MDCAITEVDQLFGMSESERTVVARMSGVGACRCVSRRDGLREGRIRDRASPPTVADALKLPVPAVSLPDGTFGDGKPHFDLDIGICGRSNRRGDAAEGRQLRVNGRPSALT